MNIKLNLSDEVSVEFNDVDSVSDAIDAIKDFLGEASEETKLVNLWDDAVYNSESRGMILVSKMENTHLANAIAKKLRYGLGFSVSGINANAIFSFLSTRENRALVSELATRLEIGDFPF